MARMDENTIVNGGGYRPERNDGGPAQFWARVVLAIFASLYGAMWILNWLADLLEWRR